MEESIETAKGKNEQLAASIKETDAALKQTLSFARLYFFPKQASTVGVLTVLVKGPCRV